MAHSHHRSLIQTTITEQQQQGARRSVFRIPTLRTFRYLSVRISRSLSLSLSRSLSLSLSKSLISHQLHQQHPGSASPCACNAPLLQTSSLTQSPPPTPIIQHHSSTNQHRELNTQKKTPHCTARPSELPLLAHVKKCQLTCPIQTPNKPQKTFTKHSKIRFTLVRRA